MQNNIHYLYLDPLFPLGLLTCTDAVPDRVNATDVLLALNRHCVCDWGELDKEDKATNDQALATGGRLFSCYRDREGVRFYVITESDRSRTTILLPEEY